MTVRKTHSDNSIRDLFFLKSKIYTLGRSLFSKGADRDIKLCSCSKKIINENWQFATTLTIVFFEGYDDAKIKDLEDSESERK